MVVTQGARTDNDLSSEMAMHRPQGKPGQPFVEGEDVIHECSSMGRRIRPPAALLLPSACGSYVIDPAVRHPAALWANYSGDWIYAEAPAYEERCRSCRGEQTWHGCDF